MTKSSPIIVAEQQPLDDATVDNDAGLALFWARSHGLLERSDRDSRLAILHATRLFVAVDPEVDPEVRRLLLELITWLVLADRTGEIHRALEFLFGNGGGTRRLEHAAVELRARIKAFGFDLALLQGPLSRHAMTSDPTGSWSDHAFEWTVATLQAFALCKLPQVHLVELTFPTSWATSVNPLAFDVEAEVSAWLHELGIIRNELDERTFQKFAVAEYAGWPCPDADHEELWVLAALLSLWLLHDDVLEGSGLRSDEVLALAVTGQLEIDSPALGDRYVRGWAELGSHTAQKMSCEWRQRQYHRFLAWARTIRREAELVRVHRQSGMLPTAEEYLPIRNVSIGMGPTVYLVEYALGQELPQAVSELPQVAAIGKLAGDLVAFPNELLGYSKDISNRMVNLVSCLVASERSEPAAFREIAQMHDQTIAAYRAEEDSLLAAVDAADEPLVMRWLWGVRHLIYGFGRWHFIAPRYSDIHKLSDGSIARVILREQAA